MPSTYSPLLRLELLGAGEQSGLWGDTTNKNVGQLLEQAIAGVTTVSLSGGAGDYTLSALDGTFDESRSAVLKFIGNPSGVKNIIIPTETKLYVVLNDCGQTITVKTSAQVTGVTLLNGEASLVFCDGTNAVAGIATAGVGPTTVSNGGTGATSFTGGFVKSPGGTGTLTSSATVNAATELSGSVGVANGGTGSTTFSAGFVKTAGGTAAFTASGISLTADVSGTLPTTNGGTGVTGFTSGALVIGNGSSPLATLTGGSVGQVATWNGSSWTAAAPGTAPVTSVFSRTGIITAQSGDYSSFYPSLTGSGASGTWSINISGSAASATTATTAGSATTATTATNSTQLGGVAAASYATLANTQTFTGNKTFSGTITSGAYNFASTTSIYHSAGTTFITISNGNQFKVESNGNIAITGDTAVKNGSTAWVNPSDRRLKENITAYTKGLTELVKVAPKTFNYNGKAGSIAGLKVVGVIADEIETVLPDTVKVMQTKMNPDDTETTNVQYFDASEITWLMVNAIKELKAEVDALKAQIQGA